MIKEVLQINGDGMDPSNNYIWTFAPLEQNFNDNYIIVIVTNH